jgi:protocatechuate 3,4-dioxygenase beta subunit
MESRHARELRPMRPWPLKLLLRSDAKGAWSFETVKPGSYPNSRNPLHIHFEVSAPGRATRIFEIVFEGDPFVTAPTNR